MENLTESSPPPKLPPQDIPHDLFPFSEVPDSVFQEALTGRSTTFHRFLDLPPELRVRIYEANLINHYHAWFSVHRIFPRMKPTQHAPPPITQTSQLVREESSPMHYRAPFVIHFETTSWKAQDLYPYTHYEIQTSLAENTAKVLRRTSDRNFALIQRFTLELGSIVHDDELCTGYSAQFVTLDIDLRKVDERDTPIRSIGYGTWDAKQRQRDLISAVYPRMLAVLEKVQQRGANQLRKADIEALLPVYHEAVLCSPEDWAQFPWCLPLAQ